MPLLFDQENNNIAECAEDGVPRTAQRQPLHCRAERQRERERDRHTHRENNQKKRARENNDTDRDKQQHNKQARQDKTREQQIIRQIKLKKKRCRK